MASWRAKVFDLVMTKQFDFFIAVCIIINTLLMAMNYYQQPTTYEMCLEIGNMIFAFVFNVEMALKLMALGTSYFYDSWNKFDFLIVIGTDVGIFFMIVSSSKRIG